MIKGKILIGLAVLIGALFVSAVPAFAEFESKVKESNKGKGELFEVTLTEGPTTITCEGFEEATSKIPWTVKSGGKEAKKGSELLFKVENWGKCLYSAAGGQMGEAKLGVCEMEIKELEEESSMPVKLANTCTIKVAGCEIKLNSQEPKAMEIRTGAEYEDTRIVPAITGIVAEVNNECAAFGIQASKNVGLTGVGELYSVEEAAPAYKTKGGKITDKQTKLALTGTKESEEVGSVHCEEAVYTVGTTGRATILTATPELLKCKAIFGKEEIKEIKTANECKEGMELSQPERFEGEEEGPGLYRSKAELLKGCKIILEAPSCTIKVAGEGEELPWAYYNSLNEITLKEPETIFEITGIKYSASEGCKANGIPASGKVSLKGGLAARLIAPNQANYGKALEMTSVDGLVKEVQEFVIANGEAKIKCEGAKFTNNVGAPGPVPDIKVSPSFEECEIKNGDNPEEGATVTNNNCVFIMGAFKGTGETHTSNFAINKTSIKCTGILFEGSNCKIAIPRNAVRSESVTYNNTTAEKMEVIFAVKELGWEKRGGCPGLNGPEVKYTGKMFFPKFIITP